VNGACGVEREADRRADEAFVRAHYRGVFRLLMWLTRSPETAADLTQETFAAFWQSRSAHTFADDRAARAWLYGIARNRWRKRCRDAGPPVECLDEAVGTLDAAPGPDACFLQKLEWERVSAAVADLPTDYREALVLRVWGELSYGQIAAALEIAEGLARWRVHRARALLRAALETGGEA
jgi:RNA polymerase sigma-70 factor (ECF subfamily)